jgi:hypothetical protein
MPCDDEGLPPQSPFEEEIKAALADVGILLEFLGRADDGRLQFYFKDTRGNIAGVIAKNTSPPCSSYAGFLSRLARIRADANKNDISSDLPASPQNEEVDPQISDLAFLLWTRDFLAAVAAPATADTIRLTESYMESRTVSFLRRLREVTAYLPKTNSVRTTSDLPSRIVKEDVVRRYAAQLASRVKLMNYLTFGITVITLVISIYALSGHQIVSARDDTINTFRTINAKIFDIETHISSSSAITVVAPSTGGSPSTTSSPPSSGTVTPTPVAAAQSSDGRVLFLCDTIRKTGEGQPSFGPIPSKGFYTYISYEVIDNCRMQRRTLTQLFAIGEQLISWQEVVTRFSAFSGLFGIAGRTIRELEGNNSLCSDFTGTRNDPKHCGEELKEIAEYYGRVPDAILGCITLYILPCLYGFIGAAAATMRYLRTKADSYLLNFTDRGTILQNVILGIVAGAVIGLFFTYIMKSSSIEGIGVSALGFLAGYNVTGLFALFDDISNRIFGGSASHVKQT